MKEIAERLYFWEREGFWGSDITSRVSYPKEAYNVFFKIEEKSFWFRHRNNVITEIVKKYPPGGTFYDVGGGNGYVTRRLLDEGFDAVLIEPGIAGCKNARARGIKKVICSTLEDAKFKEKIFPAVGIFDVLEHIKDDSLFLKKIWFHLMEGGKLYLTVPAYNLLWSNEDSFHYRRYTLKELVTKLKETNYKIRYTTYFFSFLLLPIFFLRTLPSKLGLARKRNLEEHYLRGIKKKVVAWCSKKELSKIKRGRVDFGASCLVVAEK
jgi:SAM-dependent methyltransferase